MGCDIHLMLEYRVKPEIIQNDSDGFKYEEQYKNLREAWDKLCKGEITEEEYDNIKREWSNRSMKKWYKEWHNSYMWRNET
jgi:uncharacterized membrane protein